ncbi:rhodanese-like domain-containing protein [Thiolapillus sp.]
MQVKEIDVSELKKRLDTGEDIVLLDIRSEAEVRQGILPGSEHLPMHLIPLKLQDLPKDKDVILYCRSGARSYHACAFLEQQGMHNALNLRGGILDWVRHGYEIAAPA